MPGILKKINSPSDLKKIPQGHLPEVCREIREVLTSTVSNNGGHLASNLGVVELTVALHRVFNSPRDKIIWDVGHQSYVHKLLTGRRESFATLRCYQGISGFPRREESPHDIYQTGHSSTSISAAQGLAAARDLKGEDHQVIAVIGDGALTGGMAFEALNHSGHTGTNLVVVLNDNEMSISENVGALASYLSRLRADPAYSRIKEDLEGLMKKIPGIGDTVYKSLGRLKDSLKYLLVAGAFFEELGFTYLGPIDGSSISSMVQVLSSTRKIKGPVLVHVLTKKGRGFEEAEKNPGVFHGIGPFEVKTGLPRKKSTAPTYTGVFSHTLLKLAEEDRRIVAVTAAMPSGTGLDKFGEKYPDRFFDVGIAEQHALVYCAGLAAEGFRPVFAVYSTFLQRGYDQLVHDICLQHLPVLVAVDRAGIVGEDGETHQGAFDLSFLRHIPNLVVMAPRDEGELQDMVFTALQHPGPTALRYPRGTGEGVPLKQDNFSRLEIGRGELLERGSDLLIVAIGAMVPVARQAVEELRKKGIRAALINSRFAKPLDGDLITQQALKCKKRVITVEDNVLQGGFGSSVLELFQSRGVYNVQVKMLGLPDKYIEHGPRGLLLEKYGLSVSSLVDQALSFSRNGRIRKIRTGINTK